MSTELTVYTGQLVYKDITFTFIFDKSELRLIPPKERIDEINLEWIMTPIEKGVYTFKDQLKMTEPFLVGKCNENGHKFIFVTQPESRIGNRNSVLFVQIVAFIECLSDKELIGKISFSNSEIDHIYPTNQALQYSFDIAKSQCNGIFSVTTKDNESTTTEKQCFFVDEKEVQVSFGIKRTLHSGIEKAPMTLTSMIQFEFNPTNDYSFILRLWRIAREFIRFLCYRRNINMPSADLISVDPNKDNKHERFGTIYIINENYEPEPETLKSVRYIKYEYISGHEGEILNDIADNSLYTRHFPETYESGRHIDASRFIMITAAFEWEFHREYPSGVPRSEKSAQIENIATNAIQSLIDSSSGKLRDKYQFLKKLIKSDSLEKEIIKMGKDYDEVIGFFGKYLYKLNGETLVYSEMGKRLSNQRNHFAHGDLDKDFIGLSLLDLAYMEYAVYALQLKHYGIDSNNIQKSINCLFHLNFAL